MFHSGHETWLQTFVTISLSLNDKIIYWYCTGTVKYEYSSFYGLRAFQKKVYAAKRVEKELFLFGFPNSRAHHFFYSMVTCWVKKTRYMRVLILSWWINQCSWRSVLTLLCMWYWKKHSFNISPLLLVVNRL